MSKLLFNVCDNIGLEVEGWNPGSTLKCFHLFDFILAAGWTRTRQVLDT